MKRPPAGWPGGGIAAVIGYRLLGKRSFSYQLSVIGCQEERKAEDSGQKSEVRRHKSQVSHS